MTLLFGTILAFALGLALGRRWQAFAIAAVGWYVFLVFQTIYLAQPGQTGFGGENGLHAIRGGLYWLVQPPILGLSIGLLLLGAAMHRRIGLWMRTRHGTPSTSA